MSPLIIIPIIAGLFFLAGMRTGWYKRSKEVRALRTINESLQTNLESEASYRREIERRNANLIVTLENANIQVPHPSVTFNNRTTVEANNSKPNKRRSKKKKSSRFDDI